MIPISCKYCGGYEGTIHDGKGPHKHEVKCSACGKHNKWAADVQVKEYTCDELQFLLFTEETLAISHAKGGNFAAFMAHINKAERIKEQLYERF